VPGDDGGATSTSATDRRARREAPRWWQLAIASRWPAATQLCTTSREPKPREVPSVRPLATSATPRSQSPRRPASRTVAKPDIGAR